MPITTCSRPYCAKLFEAQSEEYANEPDRLCPECVAHERREPLLPTHPPQKTTLNGRT